VVAEFLLITCGKVLSCRPQFGSDSLLPEYLFYYLVGALTIPPASIVFMIVVTVVQDHHPVRFFPLDIVIGKNVE
jgi:hypothetical protein